MCNLSSRSNEGKETFYKDQMLRLIKATIIFFKCRKAHVELLNEMEIWIYLSSGVDYLRDLSFYDFLSQSCLTWSDSAVVIQSRCYLWFRSDQLIKMSAEYIEDDLNTVYVNHLQRHSITGSMSSAKPLSSLTDKRPSYTDISMPGNKNY